MRRDLFLLAFGWVVSSTQAWANTEPPAAYDARSVGMGSTGVAHAQNGAALYHNPAALHEMGQGAVTLAISPFAPQVSSPIGTDGAEVKSKRGIFPMFLVGGAYRIDRRFTVGLAAFPTMGFGAKYGELASFGGLKLNAQLAAIEVAPGASFAITDYLAVGVTYRVTYMAFNMEQPNLTAAGTMAQSKTDLSGLGFLGAQVGLFARATETTRLGLTYRSKVSVNMKGDTEMGGQKMHTELKFAAPHTFKLGIAQSLLENRLTLALDLKLALYKESSKELALKVDVPGLGTQTQSQPLKWKNVFGFYAGAEYRFAPEGPAARLGYSMAQSATPTDYASPVLPPPGLQHAVHAGAGMSVANVDIDLGGYYLFGSKKSQPSGGAPGDYGMNAVLVALSGTYRW